MHLSCCRWLKEEKGIGVYVEPSMKRELLDDSSYFRCVQACETGAYDGGDHERGYLDSRYS